MVGPFVDGFSFEPIRSITAFSANLMCSNGLRVPKETSKQFAEVASGVMKSIEKQFNLIVPIEAEAGIGSNWAEAK